MKKITATFAALALASAVATTASAQEVVSQGAVGALPSRVQDFIAGAGGLTTGAIVTVVALGAILLITVIQSDGTTTTTTTTL